MWAVISFMPSMALPFFKSGVSAQSGLLVVWIPAFVFIAQFVVNVWAILRAIDREEREVQAVTAERDLVRG